MNLGNPLPPRVRAPVYCGCPARTHGCDDFIQGDDVIRAPTLCSAWLQCSSVVVKSRLFVCASVVFSSFVFFPFFSRPSRRPNWKNSREVPNVKMTIFLCENSILGFGGQGREGAFGMVPFAVGPAFMFFIFFHFPIFFFFLSSLSMSLSLLLFQTRVDGVRRVCPQITTITCVPEHAGVLTPGYWHHPAPVSDTGAPKNPHHHHSCQPREIRNNVQFSKCAHREQD